MNKLIVTEVRVAEDDFETVIVEETESGTIVRTIATVHYPEYADTFLHNAQELAALRSEITNYETARQEDGKRLEQVAAERDAMVIVCAKAAAHIIALHNKIKPTQSDEEIVELIDNAILKGGKG